MIDRGEWKTICMLVLAYLAWAMGTTVLSGASLALGVVVTTLAAVVHSSLQHEFLHGHPTRNPWLNGALVLPALGLFIPYLRFRDTHIAHHRDERLTDPYDDPETNFLDPAVWAGLAVPVRTVLKLNNTLLGRMVLGPAVAQVVFMHKDWRSIRAGDRRVLAGWLLHIPAVAMAVWWMAAMGRMPVWAYVLSCYGALSILKIRTYLEHRAHEDMKGRTVIIEDRGPLALLFLNNNYHFVHHTHPGMAWHRLPDAFRADRAAYLAGNDGYCYRSYGEVFRRYFLRAKDPVPHPLWRAP